MENLYTIKRLEAMDGFLGEMIDKLENHSEVTFLLDLSRSIKTEPDFDNGTFYAQCRVGMQTAAHCLRTIQTRIHFSPKELRETEGKNDSKLF